MGTALIVTADAAISSAELVARGEYIFRAAGCENCHTDRKHEGARLAGGRALVTPFGTFYTPNITPDPAHGIGRWSEADFVRAMRQGISPAGTHYFPSFPYTSYTRLTDADLDALRAYLLAQSPVAQPNRPHELPWYLQFRPLLGLWKWWYFTPGAYRPVAGKSEPWNRGRYLVTAMAHCGECHTPRNRFGASIEDMHLAGTRMGPENGVVPNITPERKTGIGRWSRSDLGYFLETGMTPDGDFAGDLMAEVIDNGLKLLTEEDRRAISLYVMSLPPIEHAVRKDKKKKDRRDEFRY